MKLTRLIIGLIFLVLFSNASSALEINPYFWQENGHLDSVISYSYMDNDKLYNELFIYGRVLNETLVNEKESLLNFYLNSREGNGANNLNLVNLSICKGYAKVDGNYRNMNFNCTEYYEPINLTTGANGLKFRINLSEVYESGFHIKIVYYSDNFIIKNGRYEVAWLTTVCTDNGCNQETRVERYLILPSDNSVIENWNNFEITGKGNGKWLLKTEGNGGSMVWFSDSEKENKDRTIRDILVLVIGFALPLIFDMLFLDKRLSRRTRNLWMFAGLFLLITCWFLLNGTRGLTSLKVILIISFILFIFSVFLATISGIKDTKKSTLKRDFYWIKKLIKDLFR
ncbi:MAG: hypothetical protein ACP5N7_06170 [Candidatus Pacearchaeota archaeon]